MFKQHPFLRALTIFLECWIIALVVLLILYFAWLRDWQMTWGATDEEVSRYMAGDELLEDPGFNATRAVEIEAPPEQIWPWIVQMGYKRAGFYGFDRLDNGGMPSAERILPEYQDLKVGDSLPLCEYKGRPVNALHVIEMERNKSMAWVFVIGPWQNTTWSWGLYPVDSEHTRLVSRLRIEPDFSDLQHAIMWGMVDVMEIVMMRTTLLGIKRRAEGS